MPTPRTSPKRDAQRTRQRILDTATRVFAQQGFEGARIDEIAEKASANKRMIYVYFSDKEGLYSEVVRELFDRLFTAGEPPDPTMPPPEQVRQALRRYFFFLAQNDHLVRLLSFELLGSGQRASAALVNQTSAGLEQMRSALTEGVRRGVFRKDLDLRQLMLSLQVLCVGHFTHQPLAKALWKRDFSDPKVLDQTAEHIVSLVLEGICTD
jgi:AcrR family transcriptional regulator